jgi:hypothetical protein
MEKPMTYRGRVENGVIVLDEAVELPEGASVTVDLAAAPEQQGISTLLKYAGCVKDLPPDASVNLDHYLYGHPKRD